MPTCIYCTAPYKQGEIICKYCDATICKDKNVNDTLLSNLGTIGLSDDGKSILKTIGNYSRSIRKLKFKHSDLSDLIDLDDDIESLENNELIKDRFSDLLVHISNKYLSKNSIILFGGTKELFEKYNVEQ